MPKKRIEKKLEKKGKKFFLLDTNVPLHDPSCVHQFEEHDVGFPIPVIEELDNFTEGNNEINVNARAILRFIKGVSKNATVKGGMVNGISLGKDKGSFSIVLNRRVHPRVEQNLFKDNYDRNILNTAFVLTENQKAVKDCEKKRHIVLVTKDTNLQIKALALGVKVEDYTTDQVKDVKKLYTGVRLIENANSQAINAIYDPAVKLTPGILQVKDLIPNEFLKIRANGENAAFGVFDSVSGEIKRVEAHNCFGLKPRNEEQNFALHALQNPAIKLVTITGKAGTGKTLIALAGALAQRSKFSQIFLARPIVALSNKDMGYLPGDAKEKVDPYMMPLYDNLDVLGSFSENNGAGGKKKEKTTKEMLADEKIVITPLAYIRGRSLVKKFFIIDEAQNLTPHEVKTIISRAGEDTKIVFTGDIFQIDNKYLDARSNGLSYIIDRMSGQSIYAHIHMEKGERSELAEIASNVL